MKVSGLVPPNRRSMGHSVSMTSKATPDGFTRLMQKLDGIDFYPCEADCSWLHREWWHGRMPWEKVVEAATDPARMK